MTQAAKRSGRSAQPNAREALLAAARDLFAERGFDNTSVVDITGRAGISVGTLYYHFGSKTDIFLAIHRAYAERLEQEVRSALRLVRAAGVLDGRRLLLAGTRAYLNGVWENRESKRVLTGDRPPATFATTVSKRWEADWTRRNLVLLRQHEPPQTSAILAAAISGAIGTWSAEIVDLADAATAEAYIEEAVGVVARLVGLPPGEPGVLE